MLKKLQLSPIPIILSILIVLAYGIPAFASLGKIAGKITDESGDSLPGANVVIVGTTMGAATDVEGRFYIINVPPGTYTVRVSFVGYATQEIQDVRAQLDRTAELNVTMKTEAVGGQMITVVAQRPMVDKTMTATAASFNVDIVDNVLPTNSLDQVLQTSVIATEMRGANKIGVSYMVDGVDISDALWPAGGGTFAYSNVKHDDTPVGTAGSTFEDEISTSGRRAGLVNTSSTVSMGQVQEVDVIAGTFNAEYSASGGVVNIASKSGGSQLTTKLFLRSSLGGLDHAGPNIYNAVPPSGVFGGKTAAQVYNETKAALEAAVQTEPALQERLNFFNWTEGKYPYGDDPRMNADLSIGGPLTSKGNFYFNLGVLNDHGRFPGEFQRQVAPSLKLNYSMSPTNRLTGMVKLDDGGKLFGWKNRQYTYMYTFFLEGQPVNDKLNTLSYLKWTKTFDQSSFLEATASYVTSARTYGYAPVDDKLQYDNYGDFLVLDTVEKTEKYLINTATRIFNAQPGNDQFHQIDAWANQIRVGRPGYLYEDFKTKTLSLKADLVKQVTFNHQLKAGAEFRRVDVNNFQQGVSIGYAINNAFPYEEIVWDLKPWSFGTYVQDRIEYEGIIVNAGVRVDGYNLDTRLPADYFDPVYLDTLANTNVIMRPEAGADAKTRVYFSPRLGISHPITENAAMHYSWGIYTTPPAYLDAFRTYNVFSNPSLPQYVDPDPDPEVATAYEIGVNVAVAQDIAADLTAYYRDTRNAGRYGWSINVAPGSGFALYSYTTSWGYRDSRGIELNLVKRSSPKRYFDFLGLSGRLSLSYSFDKGAANALSISEGRGTSALAYGTQDETYNFEDRYTYPTYSRGKDFWNGKMTLMFDFPIDIQLSTLTTYRSHWYFTPIEVADPRYEESQGGDYFLQTDLRVNKRFGLGKYTAGVFFEALNVFDRENILTFDTYNSSDQALYEKSGFPYGNFNRPVNQYGSPFAGIARELYAGIEFWF